MKRHFDDVLIGSIELFCAAAEHGGFTVAAHAWGVTPAAVSRSIARLEARLGVRLFVRSTRSVKLTDAGRQYFEQCRQAIGQLIDAERAVSGQQSAPAGLLRISAPTTYGHFRILPLLPAFRARYPEVQIEVHVSNRNIEFADQGYDLAIRAREPAESRFIARKLEDAELVVVASPHYLKRAGTPRTLDDLKAHECVIFSLPSSGRSVEWLFRAGAKEVEVHPEGGITCHEDVLSGTTLALAGAGLFQAYRFTVEGHLRSGALVEVLREYGGRSRPFSVLYPHNRHLSSRVRTFIEFLIEARDTGFSTLLDK